MIDNAQSESITESSINAYMLSESKQRESRSIRDSVSESIETSKKMRGFKLL